ncbi:MAG: ferritin-like domain-containing protein [Chitinophagaceae bacterium]|nr:ferritin-like domain-containing protein [Chitinophagaceae bacterium]
MASAKQSATSEQKENTSNQNNNSSLLEKFFIDQLKDIYYAEQQLTKALVEMKEATSTEELEDAFDTHAKQTERHVKRLEKVFQSLEKEPEGKKCEAIEGLIREAKTIINETQSGTMTRDAALIIAAQKIEHYEIATYGGLLQLALTMEREKAADLLEKTLREEEETDLLLTDVAESFINIEAEEEKKYSWNQTA